MNDLSSTVSDILDGTCLQHDAAVEAIEGLLELIKGQQAQLDYLRQRVIEDDRIIQELDERIEELEGDLTITRLQRDATHISRCPRCWCPDCD